MNVALPSHSDFVHCETTSIASGYHLPQVPKCQHQNLYKEVEQPELVNDKILYDKQTNQCDDEDNN